jgi:hypothetical protein
MFKIANVELVNIINSSAITVLDSCPTKSRTIHSFPFSWDQAKIPCDQKNYTSRSNYLIFWQCNFYFNNILAVYVANTA